MPLFVQKFQREGMKRGGDAPPEARLDAAKIGAILSPIGLFIFAFTSYGHVHWIAPIIGSIPFGTGVLYIYASVFSFTADNWRPVAASAMGANSVMRSTFAAAFPLFAEQMAHGMGTVGAAAFLAGINVLIVSSDLISVACYNFNRCHFRSYLLNTALGYVRKVNLHCSRMVFAVILHATQNLYHHVARQVQGMSNVKRNQNKIQR